MDEPPSSFTSASPETEKLIDEEVKELVAKAYKVCKETLNENRDLMDELTEALIEKETVDFVELYEMVGKYNPELAEAQKVNYLPNFDAKDSKDVAPVA